VIVVDASALVALVAGGADEVEAVAQALLPDAQWAVPQHTLIEAVSALRSMTLRGSLPRDQLADAVQRIVDFELDVWPTAPLLGRVLQLIDNVTAYDAAYLALAEELSTTLVTLDRRLATVPGVRCAVRVPNGSTSRP